MSFLEFDFMRRALVAAGLVGLAAPAIGTFMVQRRLSLMGDGIGHIALTGVALGFLTSTSPVLAALAAAALGAITIELLRERGRAAGDVALALLFYGGIAGGVFLTALSPVPGTRLFGYLFGSVLAVDRFELLLVAGLCGGVLGTVALLGKQLFAVCYDEEVARVAGLRVRALNLLMAVTAAVTVVVAMRVVGLLLVAALMVIPVAAAQNVARSFRSTVAGSLAIGLAVSAGGIVLAYAADSYPGATIVLLALAVFALTMAAARLRRARAPL